MLYYTTLYYNSAVQVLFTMVALQIVVVVKLVVVVLVKVSVVVVVVQLLVLSAQSQSVVEVVVVVFSVTFGPGSGVTCWHLLCLYFYGVSVMFV